MNYYNLMCTLRVQTFKDDGNNLKSIALTPITFAWNDEYHAIENGA